MFAQLHKSAAEGSNIIKFWSYVVKLDSPERHVYKIKKLIPVLSIVYQLPLGLHQLHKMILDTRPSCTCRPPLRSRGKVVASHLADPGSTPVESVFLGFPSTLTQMTGKLSRHQSPGIIGHQTLLFRAVPIDFTISTLHFVTSFCCRLAWLDKNCFLHKLLLTPGLLILSLVCKLNGKCCHYFLSNPCI